MPVVQVSLIRGYSSELRQRLCSRLTDAVRQTIDADPEAITFFLHEVEPDGYMRGGRPRVPGAEAAAPPGPEALVRTFLDAMEARDLALASSLLADDFTMEFPGSGVMSRLDELLAWARGRYRFVKKRFIDVDCCDKGDHTVVVCHGELYGEWPDGTAFDGVRFIDRFEVRDGKLSRQRVWNDLALARA
ncbi:MAG: nuclear transport factor 2 family protein [Halomonas sp.]|uniref:nuclear transport factor 2 family protein n=1 Tax=Halomonas sp. TaxID=1486246 RepID=UPI0019EDE60D|nr:tautomerase family protein [Halomonas sp.]MBE0487567.1 nuclear transport factor 2 family protein [Halomonas sp.]